VILLSKGSSAPVALFWKVRGQYPRHATDLGRPSEIPGVTHSDRVRIYVILKTLNVELLLWIERTQLDGFGHLSKMPRKDWRSKSCWLRTHGKVAKRLPKGPGGMVMSPTLLGPVMVLSQQNYLRLLLTWGISSLARAAAPRPTLPGQTWAGKIIQKMNFRDSIHNNAHIKSSSRFRFHSNNSPLPGSKCLQ